MEKVSVNGISLAYERCGKGAPLVLVHGFPLDHTAWQALVPSLEADFDLLLPDLRGFGQSDAPEGAYTVEQMATDLAGLLDALGIEKAYLAGHSMGGYVSLAFARLSPQRMLGLGLLGSQAAPDTAEGKAKRFTTAEQVAHQGVSAVLGMAEKLSANSEHVLFFREIIQRQRLAGLIGALNALAGRPDSLPLFSTFQFPVVLVHGLGDVLIPVERAREIKSAQPSVGLIELPGVGHSPALEALFETAEALKWLRRK